MPDMVEVAYIDTQIGSSTGYIRCHSCEDAKILLDKSCGENYQLKLVTGQYKFLYIHMPHFSNFILNWLVVWSSLVWFKVFKL